MWTRVAADEMLTMLPLLGHLLDRREFVDARIVDEDVEPAELPDRRLDQGLRLGGPGYVALHGDRLAAGRRDGRDDGVRSRLARRVIDHDLRAVPCQRLGDRRTDPFGGARHHGDLAIELCHVCYPFAGIGTRSVALVP
jgi:hypothetical protein